MAQHLAKIFGTEEDKVNCPFYLKMGACRHGDRCSRIHNRPILSQTILLQNMFLPPPQQYGQDGLPIPQDEDDLQDHFEDFYEDIFEELTKVGGELEQLLTARAAGHASCVVDAIEGPPDGAKAFIKPARGGYSKVAAFEGQVAVGGSGRWLRPAAHGGSWQRRLAAASGDRAEGGPQVRT